MKPQDTETSLSDLRRAIRQAGLRATASRIAVLGLLLRGRKPLSHAEVVATLSDQPWNRATLYRNLVDLVEAGLVMKTVLGDRVWRFVAGSVTHAAGDHPHFVCTECGKVLCLPDLQVRMGRPDTGPQAVRDNHVEIQVRGRCDDCEDD